MTRAHRRYHEAIAQNRWLAIAPGFEIRLVGEPITSGCFADLARQRVGFTGTAEPIPPSRPRRWRRPR